MPGFLGLLEKNELITTKLYKKNKLDRRRS